MIKHIAILFTLLITASAVGGKECIAHAQNAMERAYCEVKAAGFARQLPSLHHFRRNNTTTQRLLLKKLAERAGVTLPPAIEQKVTAPKKNSTIDKPQIATPLKTLRPPGPSSPNNPNKAGLSLSRCTLNPPSILCPNGTFTLVNNLQVKQLVPGALDVANRLSFPDKRAIKNQRETHYLSALYGIYLEKMLSIGLAGATMSYTKFVTMYQLHEANGVDPKERFTTMFELLKTERKTQSIQARYSPAMPKHINQCMPLGSTLIVCDNVHVNWVFQK